MKSSVVTITLFVYVACRYGECLICDIGIGAPIFIYESQ